MRSRCLMGIACGLLISAGAQGAEERSALMAEYVSPSALVGSKTDRTEAPRTKDNTIGDDIIAVSNHRTEADRWMDFQNEYGIHNPDPSWALSMIQAAKFQLDKLSFGAKETARKLEFTYDFGGSDQVGSRAIRERSAYSLPLFGEFGQPQLKSVLTEHDQQTATPFMGLQLKVPFGKGASDY